MRSHLKIMVVAILLLVQVLFTTKGFVVNAQAMQHTTRAPTTPVKRYALVVCGSSPNMEGLQYTPPHRGDAAYMYHVLTSSCTFESIEYLSVYHSDPGVTGTATVQHVKDAVHRLVYDRENPKSSDIIFIYISTEGVGLNEEDAYGHQLLHPSIQYAGGRIIAGASIVSTYYDYDGNEVDNNPINVDGGLVLEDTTFQDHGPAVNAYWGTDLKADLTDLNGNNGMLVYVQQSCFAGDMIFDLSGPNRTIMCATKETWGARGDSGFDYPNSPPTPPDWGFGISEWSERFMDALNGQRAYFANDTGQIMENRVGNQEAVQADNDGNGVSMLEAWQYALTHDEAHDASKEFPWFDDNGNQKPTYNYGDVPDGTPTEGILSNRIFLSPLIGDVNGDLVVDIYDAIILSGAFNTRPGYKYWDPRADFNKDNIIDLSDAIILAGHFGAKRPDIVTGRSGGPSARPMTEGGVSVSIDPSQVAAFKGEVFNINVNVAGVTDLLGWEFKLFWNNTMLNCTNAAVQTPAEWQDNAQNYGPGLENNFNTTHARFWAAQSANRPAPSFNGSMSIATLTFQALQLGTTSLSLMETKLGNSTADPIDHTELSGSVSVYYGRYMRSDTQQVNGLSAYKLNIPQSTSSAVNTQSGSGMGASWGIRAWVRHSNGVEQEISLDGHTGTPEAKVGGGSAGIRSSTVSVAQTALQSTDSLVVRVYVQIGEGPWNLCAAFTTEQLQASALKATVWTVYYYTFSTYNRITDRTTAKFYWGTATYNSRMQDLQFS